MLVSDDEREQSVVNLLISGDSGRGNNTRYKPPGGLRLQEQPQWLVVTVIHVGDAKTCRSLMSRRPGMTVDYGTLS